jgi:hypothetical protein
MNTVREQTKTKQRGTQNNVNSKADTDTVTTFEYKITKSQVNAVLKLIQRGYSKRAACLEIGVNRSTFDSAVTRLSAADQYARATSALAEEQINLLENVIDDLRNGKITPEMARIEVDTRKWMASKLLPKKYGDKVEHEGNVNVIFSNGIPRPKYIEGQTRDTISSVPLVKGPKKSHLNRGGVAQSSLYDPNRGGKGLSIYTLPFAWHCLD